MWEEEDGVSAVGPTQRRRPVEMWRVKDFAPAAVTLGTISPLQLPSGVLYSFWEKTPRPYPTGKREAQESLTSVHLHVTRAWAEVPLSHPG